MHGHAWSMHGHAWDVTFYMDHAWDRMGSHGTSVRVVSVIRHNSMRSHVSQCFHCVKTDNVQKNEFLARNNAF